MNIRLLTEHDAEEFIRLRNKALTREPYAFARALEDGLTPFDGEPSQWYARVQSWFWPIVGTNCPHTLQGLYCVLSIVCAQVWKPWPDVGYCSASTRQLPQGGNDDDLDHESHRPVMLLGDFHSL